MQRKQWFGMVVVALTLLSTTPLFAKSVCVKVEGEGAIVKGDVPSAKAEALSRAKWAAVEQVAGVEVKSRTIVEDSALLDDVIATNVRGVVTSHAILKENRSADSVSLLVNACVEPSSAKAAVESMALNTAISVFIPTRRLGSGDALFDDENILTENLLGKLAERGFTVRDIAESHALDAKKIETSLRNGNFLSYRSLVYRYLTNSILIGKVEPVLSVAKNEDVGYGIKTPFNTVTARLTYRLLCRDVSGRIAVLAAGAEEANGLAPNSQDAYAAALKALADKFAPVIMEKLLSRLPDIGTKVRVKIEGVKEPSETFAVRDLLQKIPWVMGVEDATMDEFLVSYPDNPIYLASGLNKRGFRIITYSRDAIRVRRTEN